MAVIEISVYHESGLHDVMSPTGSECLDVISESHVQMITFLNEDVSMFKWRNS